MFQSDFSRRIVISRWFPLHLALLLLMIPIKLLLALLISAIAHEVSHLLAIRLCGIDIQSVSIGVTGARIKTASMENYQELICSVAGPFGSFLILLFAKYVPLIAVCSLIQGLFNLLPIGTMDGARILRCILQMTMDKMKAKQWQMYIEHVILFLVVAGFIFFCLKFRLNFFWFTIPIFLILRKRPCKLFCERVQ